MVLCFREPFVYPYLLLSRSIMTWLLWFIQRQNDENAGQAQELAIFPAISLEGGMK